ncbi:MAG: FAD-dependent oxidoreductase [Planctomycetota bacterium]
MSELRVPILLVGGGVGGCAAALALARNGGRCLLAEPTAWVGGQLTAQAVPPDENPWIEPGKYAGANPQRNFRGATASYLDYRQRVRAYTKRHRALTDAAMADDALNPGGGWVSHLCHEPRIGEAVLREMFRAFGDRIDVRCGWLPMHADRDGAEVRSVTFVQRDPGALGFTGWTNNDVAEAEAVITVTADVVLDATELGELYPLLELPHRIGAEDRAVFGEMHARPDRAVPEDQQAISWCFALTQEPDPGSEADHVSEAPADYETWKAYVPEIVDPEGDATQHGPWTGPLFAWRVPGHEAGKPLDLSMVPWPDAPEPGRLEMWRYRRIVDAAQHADGGASGRTPDVSVINCVQMDFFRSALLVGLGEPQDGNVFTQSVADAEVFRQSRRQSEAFLHWIRVDAPRHDTEARTGYPGLRLRGDELGTRDGFAMTPYIREARRPVCRAMLTEAHVGAEQRLAAGHAALDEPSAVLHTPTPACEAFDDAIAIGHYRLDLHPSAAGRGGMYAACCPFQIPLGALLPADTSNLIAAGKALGVTHLTNAATRLHPVEWAVGEAAGTLAALAVRAGDAPADFHGDTPRTATLQHALKAQGAPLAWPWRLLHKTEKIV